MADTSLPLVPPRNNQRLSYVKTTVETRDTPADELSDDLIDEWTQAVVLYHNLEWQESAESFLYLSRTIENELQATACLINSAIIFARLGDYSTASHILEDAMPVDELLALTLFVTGHVEFQLGEIEKSRDCFAVALSAMRAPIQDYHQFGINFSLSVGQIQDDLRALDGVTAGNPSALTALPAECLFTAPARAESHGSPAQSSKRSSSIDSSRLPALSEANSTPPRTPLSPIERAMEYGADGLRWHVQDDESFIENKLLRQDSANMSVEDKAPPLPLKKPSTIQVFGGGLTRRLSTQKRPQSPSKPVGIPQKRNRKLLLPREARVQDDSVHELADYVAHLPAQNHMEPRDAEAESGDVAELTDFFRSESKPRPLNVPSNRRPRPASIASSIYSQKAASIKSVDLVAWDSISTRSSSPSPYRYRSGVGTYLAHGHIPTSAPRSRASSRSPLSREADNASTHQKPSKSLHPPINDATGDRSWPLAAGIAESLSNMSLSREGSIRSLPKRSAEEVVLASIPTRKSSLMRPHFSFARPGSSRNSMLSKKPTPSIMSDGTKKSRVDTFRFMGQYGRF